MVLLCDICGMGIARLHMNWFARAGSFRSWSLVELVTLPNGVRISLSSPASVYFLDFVGGFSVLSWRPIPDFLQGWGAIFSF